MLWITKDLRAPLCAGLNIVLHLLDTLPSFPANLTYQSSSPIVTGFVPETYGQWPWLGLHSLDLAHILPPNSCRKVEDILKEAILRSTGGNAATTVSTGLSASTSTAPLLTGQDADELPWEGFPSTSSPTIHFPTKRKYAPGLLLHAQLARSGSSSSSWELSVHSQIEKLFELVGLIRLQFWFGQQQWVPCKGSPARSKASGHMRDLSTRKQCQMEALKSSLEMRPVVERMMSWTLLMRQTYHKGVCLCLTSLPDISADDDEDSRKCKVHANMLAKVTLTSQHGETNSSMRGQWVYKSGTACVNDYADAEKRRPKNPDTIGAPISYMKECGVFQPLPFTTNPLGLCHFYPMDPSSLSTLLHSWNHPPPRSISNVSWFSWKPSAGHISLLCSKVAPLRHWGYCRNCIRAMCLCVFQSSCLMKAKDWHKPWVSCCPFCTYTVQNDPAYLNHIISTHYHMSLTCGACLDAIAMLGQQLKRHLSECCMGWPLFPRNCHREVHVQWAFT